MGARSVAFASLVFVFIFLTQEKVGLDLKQIHEDLKVLHSQASAAEIVKTSLNDYYHDKEGGKGEITILALVGPSGVGKTLTANIIKKNFQSGKIEVRFPMTAEAKQSSLAQINSVFDRFYLVLIEDLQVNFIEELLSFIQSILTSSNVLIICVFNIQETKHNLDQIIHYEYVDLINKSFSESPIRYNLAVFKEFTFDDTNKWVSEQILSSKVSPKAHSEILKTVLYAHDVKYQGFKGLKSKIDIETMRSSKFS